MQQTTEGHPDRNSDQTDLRLVQQRAALVRLTRLRHTLYRRWGGFAEPSVVEDLEQMRRERDQGLVG